MTKKIDISRRTFIKRTALLTAASSVGAPFALDLFKMNQAAAALTTGLSDYKALVCIYLAGGNDHNNMILATDPTSWAGYLAARDTRGSNGNASIGLINPDNTKRVLAITPTYNSVKNKLGFSNTGREFGLHYAMAPMQNLFTTGKAAIVANVGPLVVPILSKAAYNSSLKPNSLFSHSDQTAQWQTSQNNPAYGWGGRVAEQVIGNNNLKPNFTCISSSGNTLFLAGNGVNQYQISANGSATAIQGMSNSQLFGITIDNVVTSPTYGQPFKNIITPTTTNYLEIDHAAVVQRAVDARADLNTVMNNTSVGNPNANPPQAPGSTPVPLAPTTGTGSYVDPVSGQTVTNSLATQLNTVARIIAGRSILGNIKRQVFFVTLGGFDTHDFQTNNHASLMARLAHAMDYFNTALTNLPGGPMNNNVTTFTSSDFGRTFTSNGDGTDHGWGSHHFVVGGAVNGGDVYGSFPDTFLKHNLDIGSGNLIPQISVDQYAATLAKWFGVTDIAAVFPNLGAFSVPDLGFMA